MPIILMLAAAAFAVICHTRLCCCRYKSVYSSFCRDVAMAVLRRFAYAEPPFFAVDYRYALLFDFSPLRHCRRVLPRAFKRTQHTCAQQCTRHDDIAMRAC